MSRTILVGMAASLLAAAAVVIFGVRPAQAGEWCVFPDGTHVHVGCSLYESDSGSYSRHRHDDDGDDHDHPAAPEFSEADCVVHHAATPAQLCPSGDGLQYYFIGADGSAEAGPYLPWPSEGSPSFQYFSGTNPMTQKPVIVYWDSASNLMRVGTYYADNGNDINKLYVFTVDREETVNHISW